MFLWMTPEAALLGQGDGQLALGDRIHGRGDDRDVEMDVARELRADVDVAGNDVTVGGLQQDIIERDALIRDSVLHGSSSERLSCIIGNRH